MEKQVFERGRSQRGKPYSLEEFRAKYGLDRQTAEDLFRRFGPSSIELDLLMAAKGRKPTFEAIAADVML